jgi:hypothetical protein
MKSLLLGLSGVCLMGAALVWSGTKAPQPEFDFKQEERNPVSHLRLNNNPAEFQFAIVSDRTGGHRAKVFSRAVEQLNLMQPEFVLSVGDLIEGYTEDKEQLTKEWREFQGYVARLQMPFFYVPGNHDLANLTQDKLWKEKFGRRYYDFVYGGVLFLMLNSEDPPGKNPGNISAEQVAFIKRSVERNKDCHWTLLFLHKPMWVYDDGAKNGWADVEKILTGRPYTVFAGHVHRYQKFLRNGQHYYQLATTGGSSRMRGTDYGELDHIVWVTMKQDGPVLANILLDGILPEDLRTVETGELGAPEYYRKPTHPVRGTVTFQGQPVPQAYVVLQSADPKEPRRVRADAFTQADGSFILSTYTANDGVPAGEYTVTIVQRKPLYDAAGKPGPNQLPPRYANPETSGLKATIKSGPNELNFNLQK